MMKEEGRASGPVRAGQADAMRLVAARRASGRGARDDHHGAGGFAQDLLRGAADEQVVDGGVAMRAHHDKIRRVIFGLLEDAVLRGAADLHGLDLGDAASLEVVAKPGEVGGGVFFARGDGVVKFVQRDSVVAVDDEGLHDVEQNNARVHGGGERGGGVDDAGGGFREVYGCKDCFHGGMRERDCGVQ